ncbi:MAG: phenylalanine--tRNA ligase subunit beta [Crocinitomicaceae bacterium]
MKVSYNWLKKYIDTDLSPVEMSEILTDTGLEVEGLRKIEAVKGGLEGVFVGEILSVEQHPDADRLKITTVSVGSEPLQIVCGATNARTGIKVIVATVGCTLWPSAEEAFKIKKSKIRGIESLGMLCAEDELGLGKGHDGILELEMSATVGTPASTYFDLEDDYEIEIGLTPNRSDAMGHIGVARDLVAYLNVHNKAGLRLNFPSVESFKIDNNDLRIAVSVEAQDVCPRYMGVTISGINVAPSPVWLQKSLRSIGLTPINNVVDATNYVMHELGTPLHAFDAAKLNGKVVVKTAREGEIFKTLDDVDRKLSSSNLMITNGSDNLCIAGILGGADSGIRNETIDIFLESAYFNPVSVRKTAKMFALNTDASFRFERGVDPNLTDYALKRTVLLIQELAGGKVSMDVVDTNQKPINNKVVSFDYERCNKLIGENLTVEMVNSILENLDIKIVSTNQTELELDIPAYRIDVTREADVIEEVLRIYGFNNVPIPEKLNSSITRFIKPDIEKIQNVISDMLVGMGFSEALNNSLTKSEYSVKLGGEVVRADRNVEMLNPLSQDLDVMRQSLLFNVMEMVARNQNRQNSDLKLYEYGKTYHKFDNNYSENKRLIVALTGRKEKESWNSTKEKHTYYSIKGTALAIFKRLGIIGMLKEKAINKSLLQDGVSLYVLKKKVGEIGWVSPQMKKYFGIKNDVFVADLDWDEIVDSLKFTKIKYTELPKTFAVRRDFSLLLDSKVNFSEIEEIAKNCDRKILQEVRLFDVYEGNNLEDGKKSYAVSFKFQDAEKTLKDQQVDTVMDKIRSELESKLNAQLR